MTEKKFIFISSSLGSIAAMEDAAPTLAYGVSKAAANYFVRKIHYEEKRIIALAIHPGYVCVVPFISALLHFPTLVIFMNKFGESTFNEEY